MKKAVLLVLLCCLAFAFSACAPVKTEKTRVKCPACGYEFDAPATR
jgi:hypothetical protein